MLTNPSSPGPGRRSAPLVRPPRILAAIYDKALKRKDFSGGVDKDKLNSDADSKPEKKGRGRGRDETKAKGKGKDSAKKDGNDPKAVWM